ncbi:MULTISPECIES: GGDEF domain-containing protein [Protofrankia]|uniref:Diguanylate cyclase n=1 Tax=Candidatus Protofrankia datiscae TaxID=2716812 RepID=F8B0K9_9ACTN|nr:MULTISPECIES: GGDEF domain-containing protein [Protofrankia]AEH09767.1 diguanylate cyclase [Candidatus Protofrankia datiscae]
MRQSWQRGGRAARQAGERLAEQVSHFALWSLPPRLVRYFVAVDVLCLVVVLVSLFGLSFRFADLFTFGAFVLLGRLAMKTSRHLGVPGLRKDEPHRDLLSNWTLPVTLLLPPLYAAVLHIPLHCLFRSRGQGATQPRYRQVFNAAALGVSGFCAASVHRALAPPQGPYRIDTLVGSSGRIGALVVAVFTYTVLNRVLLRGMLWCAHPRSAQPARRPFAGGRRETLAVDAAEMCSAIGLAVLWTAHPLLMLTATPPALLLQRSLLHAELLQAARTDAKTRLANPAYWRETAEKEVLRIRRSGRPMSVLIVDIDHFKKVNDQFGHLAGDAVLMCVADALRAATRPRDLVGRFGGEEFVIMLCDTDLDAAARAADRIRRQVAGMRCRADSHAAGVVCVSVTVSVGVATAAGTDVELAALLETADAALYRAKADGRNRVRLAAGLTSRASHASHTPTTA